MSPHSKLPDLNQRARQEGLAPKAQPAVIAPRRIEPSSNQPDQLGPRPPHAVPMTAGTGPSAPRPPSPDDVRRPPAAATLATLTKEQCNTHLPVKTRRAIAALRNKLEAGPSYNTFNDIALICRRAQTLMAKGVDRPFEAAWNMGPPPVADDGPYLGGNCFGTAVRLQSIIEKELGLKTCLISKKETSNVLSRWPSPIKEGPEDVHRGVVDMMGGHLHMDVAIPMLGPNQAICAFLIQCGNGAKGGTLTLNSANEHDAAQLRAEHIVTGVNALRWQAIRAGWRVFILDQSTGGHLGIDLFSGTMYVDRSVPNAVSAANLPKLRDISGGMSQMFSFGELVWRSSNLDDDDEVEVANNAHEWQMCRDFIGTLGQVFGQGETFTQDVEFLMRHYASFVEQVLVQPAAAMQYTYKNRQEAFFNGTPLEYLASQWGAVVVTHLKEPRELLKKAAQKVHIGEKVQAAWLYDDAKTSYIKAQHELLGPAQKWCAQRGAALGPLKSDMVRRLPVELLVHIWFGLGQADGGKANVIRVIGQAAADGAAQMATEVWPDGLPANIVSLQKRDR